MNGGVAKRLMSLRGYARHRGCAPSAVAKAVAAHRISRLPDGQIDPEVADAEWERNTRQNGNGHGSPRGSFMYWKTVREEALASMATLDAAVQRGELISLDEAVRIWEDALARMRTKMLAAISSRARRLVNLPTVAECHAALEEVIHETLAEAASVGTDLKGLH